VTLLLLLSLAQFQGLAMWTDSSGVVHVASSREAPLHARPLEGGSYSVVDADSRPRVLADGGTREADSEWWRGRFRAAREAVASARLLERAAREQLDAASQEVCVTAEATATVRLPARPGHRQQVLTPTVTDRQTRCTRAQPHPALRELLAQRTADREHAELALRRLEQAAVAERVPLSDWY
jgi:hypothetical protein